MSRVSTSARAGSRIGLAMSCRRPRKDKWMNGLLRVCAKKSAGQEAYFKPNDPHPDPLPSDGRGNSQIRLLHILQRLDTPTDRARFSLSHPMGEGRGEGESAPKSEVVFARVLRTIAAPVALAVTLLASGCGEKPGAPV